MRAFHSFPFLLDESQQSTYHILDLNEGIPYFPFLLEGDRAINIPHHGAELGNLIVLPPCYKEILESAYHIIELNEEIPYFPFLLEGEPAINIPHHGPE